MFNVTDDGLMNFSLNVTRLLRSRGPVPTYISPALSKSENIVNVPLWMPIFFEEISFILFHLNRGLDDTKKEGSASHPLSSFTSNYPLENSG